MVPAPASHAAISMCVFGNLAFVRSLQLTQESCLTGSFFGKTCIEYIGQNVSKWSIGAVAVLYWRHSLKNLLDYMRSGGPLHASTLAQLWDATMQNRNLKMHTFLLFFVRSLVEASVKFHVLE